MGHCLPCWAENHKTRETHLCSARFLESRHLFETTVLLGDGWQARKPLFFLCLCSCLCIADEFLPQGASSDDEETIAVEESNENESGEQWRPYRH